MENQATGNAIRSSYQKNRSTPPKQPDQENRLCSYCGKKGNGVKSSAQRRKSTYPAYNHQCSHCKRLHHFEDVCRSKDKPKTPKEDQTVTNNQGAIYDALCSATVNSVSADHHVHQKSTNNGNNARQAHNHPFIKLSIRVEDQDYVDLRFKPIVNNPESFTIPAMADTGCQNCLAGFKIVQRLGLTKNDFIPVKMRMHAANDRPINILGVIIMRISGVDQNNNVTETRQMTYITKDSNSVFLNKAACIDLGMISENFPTVGGVSSSINLITDKHHSCNCPKRELPPPLPSKLPFPATPENCSKLQDFLLDYYKSSTFTCEHQPLPLMSGPPLKLCIDPNAVPVAHHSPIPVPVHWQERVKADLNRDVRLGVIEPVPVGDPITWCHRMVVCSKKNGEPR